MLYHQSIQTRTTKTRIEIEKKVLNYGEEVDIGGRPDEQKLKGNKWKTLIPKTPERKIIDGLTFIAEKSDSYVYLAKESLTKEIYIDGLKLDEDERKKDIAIISNQTEIKVINSLTNDVKIYKYLK